MKIKLRLQSEDPDEFELDLMECFSSVPVIIGDKMFLRTYTTVLDTLDSTYNQLPETLKKMLDQHQTRSFYLKSSLLTITGLTAYSIDIGFNKSKDAFRAAKIFDAFNKERGYTMILCNCFFPSGSMVIYFQALGDIFLEFDLEDVFFLKDSKDFYKISDLEYKERDKINNQDYNEITAIIRGKK
ncbi:hypothetical protein [Leptotrichia sp. oral taxon 879]|uniref:hypothetical protein n=1 Tax=Leptotrichia sp. oral taxon 879 TaxID=1227267 RepID=UPI0003AE178D|nr:hypothetical protein [Leptotrichia sp. oral taxon 879]ERK51769.1 hypothetical protein HMPREF1552_00966 [Leptotrichia sp. oral taxon 879 str. F0557]